MIITIITISPSHHHHHAEEEEAEKQHPVEGDIICELALIMVVISSLAIRSFGYHGFWTHQTRGRGLEGVARRGQAAATITEWPETEHRQRDTGT
jgi:hypothetical protein